MQYSRCTRYSILRRFTQSKLLLTFHNLESVSLVFTSRPPDRRGFIYNGLFVVFRNTKHLFVDWLQGCRYGDFACSGSRGVIGINGIAHSPVAGTTRGYTNPPAFAVRRSRPAAAVGCSHIKTIISTVLIKGPLCFRHRSNLAGSASLRNVKYPVGDGYCPYPWGDAWICRNRIFHHPAAGSAAA